MADNGNGGSPYPMSGLEKGINAFLAGLITVAVVATLVRAGSQTPQVLAAAGGAVGQSLFAAQGIR